MKYCCLIFFSFIFHFSAQSQSEYTVIKVNGNIQKQVDNEYLTRGDIINEQEQLLFETPYSKAAVVNPYKGRLILSAHVSGNGRTNFLPPATTIATRAGNLSNMIDIQNYFMDTILLLQTNKYKINPGAFPQNEKKFFFLRYLYNNETINKKLPFIQDTLIFDKHAIYLIDNEPIEIPENKNIKLFYREGNKSIFINEFTLVTPGEKDIHDEVSILLRAFNEKDESYKIREVSEYLNGFYGKISRENTALWIKTTLK
jgi:hypothetical protein